MDRNNNAKRLFCLLLTAALLCLQVSVSCADTTTKWNYEYEVTEENTARIVRFHGSLESVIIPEELDGYPVTEIGNEAFKLKRTIYSVYIPDTVTAIGSQAFSSCDGIEEIRLSKNLKSLGFKAFSNCKGLRSIELPESLEDIGYNPFNLCDNLTDVSFSGENKLYEIRNGALIRKADHCLISWFHALGTEDSYLVPKDIKTIGENAFCTCQDLKAVTLPEGLEVIEESAFNGCTELTEIILPQSLKLLGNKAFQDCNKLQEVIIPDQLTDLAGNPFIGCAKLTRLVISASHPTLEMRDGVLFHRARNELLCCPQVKTMEEYDGVYNVPEGTEIIGVSAFEGSQLRRINVPDTVTTIRNLAFSYCQKLEEISLPDSVTSIGSWAFEYCISLRSIRIPAGVDTLPTLCLAHNEQLEEVILPEGLKAIGDSAFALDKSLKEINLP